MKFISDPPKRATNLKKRQLDLDDAEHLDWETAIIAPTYPGKRGEPRFKAIGFLRDDLVAVIFSPLGTEAVSVISLRPASRKERRQYADQ